TYNSGATDAVKQCYEIDCATYTPCEVRDHYLCLIFRNMTARSHPELYEHNIKLALRAHEYRVSYRNIAKVQTIAGSATSLGAATDGAFGSLMHALEMQVVDIQDKYGTEFEFVMDVALPT